MKQLVIYILIANTLASTFMAPIAVLDFELRRDYIEKVLCIERDKPISTCKGSCYLFKRLRNTTTPPVQQNEKKDNASKLNISFFFNSINRLIECILPSNSKDKKIAFFNDLYFNTFLHEIFHPPKFSL